MIGTSKIKKKGWEKYLFDKGFKWMVALLL